jgi:hypothetical protein
MDLRGRGAPVILFLQILDVAWRMEMVYGSRSVTAETQLQQVLMGFRGRVVVLLFLLLVYGA